MLYWNHACEIVKQRAKKPKTSKNKATEMFLISDLTEGNQKEAIPEIL